MNSILIHPHSKEQEELFEKMAKAFNVPYEIKEDSPYREEFVEMVREAEEEYLSGKGKKINLDDICK
jgi:hypothetical protein